MPLSSSPDSAALPVVLQPAQGLPVALAAASFFTLVCAVFAALLLRKLAIDPPAEAAGVWTLRVFGGALALGALVLAIFGVRAALSRMAVRSVRVEAAARLSPGEAFEARAHVSFADARLALVCLETYAYSSNGEHQEDERVRLELPLAVVARTDALVHGRTQLPADAPPSEPGHIRWELRLSGRGAFAPVDEGYPVEVR